MPESDTTIEEIAASLRKRRDQQQASIIFLGSRASEFYRNAELYHTLAQHIPEFANLSDIDRSRRCYEVLSSYYSETEIHHILSSVARKNDYRDEDNLLVKLVQAGYSNTIITTHIGTLLENAFTASLREHQDYQVIIPEIHQGSQDIFRRNTARYGRIIKAFGDLESHKYYTAGHPFQVESDRALQGFLEEQLQKDVLLIGYDQAWDQGIERAFLPQGGTIWYVNENAPPASSQLAQILQQRPGKYLLGEQGRYPAFMRALYNQIGRTTSHPHIGKSGTPGAAPPSQFFTGQPPGKKKAFISYSRADSRHLDRFRTHLRGRLPAIGLGHRHASDLLEIWCDRDIPNGDRWEEQIQQALESACVAVLLVSVDFMASHFIWEYELPILLHAADEERLKLLIFVLSPCSIKDSVLAQYQVVNDINGSFIKMSSFKKDELWDDLARQVFNILRSV